MSSIKHSAILFTDNDGSTTAGKLQTTYYTGDDRLKRAAMKLGLFWLLSAASLPIIFAHWVLVPGFFLAGPWMAYRTYHSTFTHNHSEGVCPVCKQDIEIKMEAHETLPKWTYCPACNTPLHITEACDTVGESPTTPAHAFAANR